MVEVTYNLLVSFFTHQHDSMRKTDSWLLESVQVFHPLTKKRYMFMCNHWFSLYKEDGLIARELFGIRSAKTSKL